MKRFSFLFSIVFCSLVTYGQKCTVTNSRENFLYANTSNFVDVAIDGSLCKHFTLTTDNGELKTTDKTCHFEIIPERVGNAKISIISKKTKHTVGAVEFRVDRYPKPVASIGGRYDGDISKDVLSKQTGISADIINMDIDARVVVTGFNVSVFRNNDLIATTYCDSAIFLEKVQNAFSKIEVGDIVLFSSISYQSPNDKGYLRPIELRIVKR